MFTTTTPDPAQDAHHAVLTASAYVISAFAWHVKKIQPKRTVQATEPGSSRRLVLFSSNDYLGLASHPDVKRAAARAASSYGAGPRSSAIVAGHTSLHEDLERRLAALKHAEACLLFPSGAPSLHLSFLELPQLPW